MKKFTIPKKIVVIHGTPSTPPEIKLRYKTPELEDKESKAKRLNNKRRALQNYTTPLKKLTKYEEEQNEPIEEKILRQANSRARRQRKKYIIKKLECWIVNVNNYKKGYV